MVERRIWQSESESQSQSERACRTCTCLQCIVSVVICKKGPERHSYVLRISGAGIGRWGNGSDELQLK